MTCNRNGLLEQVNFEEGSDVQAGDLLYGIEQAPFLARAAAARASVTKTETSLVRAINYQKRIKNIRTGGVSATYLESARSLSENKPHRYNL